MSKRFSLFCCKNWESLRICNTRVPPKTFSGVNYDIHSSGSAYFLSTRSNGNCKIFSLRTCCDLGSTVPNLLHHIRSTYPQSRSFVFFLSIHCRLSSSHTLGRFCTILHGSVPGSLDISPGAVPTSGTGQSVTGSVWSRYRSPVTPNTEQHILQFYQHHCCRSVPLYPGLIPKLRALLCSPVSCLLLEFVFL